LFVVGGGGGGVFHDFSLYRLTRLLLKKHTLMSHDQELRFNVTKISNEGIHF